MNSYICLLYVCVSHFFHSAWFFQYLFLLQNLSVLGFFLHLNNTTLGRDATFCSLDSVWMDTGITQVFISYRHTCEECDCWTTLLELPGCFAKWLYHPISQSLVYKYSNFNTYSSTCELTFWNNLNYTDKYLGRNVATLMSQSCHKERNAHKFMKFWLDRFKDALMWFSFSLRWTRN